MKMIGVFFTHTDLSTYLSESTVHKGMSISFAETTYKVMLKIVLALSSENLFINGIGYVKSGNVEVDPILNTNLYLIKCSVLGSGESFNSFINNTKGESEGYKTIYIPGLIKTNLGGFLKI